MHKSSATDGWSLSLRVSAAESPINHAVFSPDGGQLAILLNYRSTLQIVDVVTSNRRDIKRRCPGPVTALSFSPDGRMLLCKSDQKFEIIDVGTGEGKQILEGHGRSVLSVHFVSDIILVFSRPARLWELATGTTRLLLDDPRSKDGVLYPLVKGELSPDGRFLFTVREDGTSQLWDAVSGRPQTVQGQRATFSPQGQFVAIKDVSNHNFCIWEFAQHWSKRTTLGCIPWLRIAFSPDCRFIAAEGISGVCLWDINGQKVKKGQERGRYEVRMAFSNDSKLFAWAFGDHIEIWDTAGQALARKLPHSEFRGTVKGIAFSPSDEMLISVSGDYIQHWDTRETLLKDEPTRVRTKNSSSLGASLVCPVNTQTAISYDHNIVAVSYDSKIEVWDAARGSIIHTLTMGGSRKSVSILALSPNGQLLAAVIPGGTSHLISHSRPSSHTVLWNTNTGSKQDLGIMDCWNVDALVFSADNSVLVAADYTGVQVWAATGEELCKFAPGCFGPISLAISPIGDLMVLSTPRRKEIWKVTGILQGVPVQTRLEDSPTSIDAISFSPDGRLFAVYGLNYHPWPYNLHLWDVTGTQLSPGKIFSGLERKDDANIDHSCCVIAWSPDGKSLAALFTKIRDRGEKKHVVRLLDVVTGDRLGSYEVLNTLPPRYLSFSPCGSFLLTSDGAKRVLGTPSRSSPAIFIKDSWIQNDGEDLVILPADYRRSVLFVVGRNVVFTDGFQDRLLQFSDSGHFTFQAR